MNTYGGVGGDEDAIKFDVPVIDLSKFVSDQVGHGHEPKHRRVVLMKLDVEGSEYALLQRMLVTGALRHINVLTVAWHYWMCNPAHIEVSGKPNRTISWNNDDCLSFQRVFAKIAASEFDIAIKEIDDQSFLDDGRPLPVYLNLPGSTPALMDIASWYHHTQNKQNLTARNFKVISGLEIFEYPRSAYSEHQFIILCLGALTAAFIYFRRRSHVDRDVEQGGTH